MRLWSWRYGPGGKYWRVGMVEMEEMCGVVNGGAICGALDAAAIAFSESSYSQRSYTPAPFPLSLIKHLYFLGSLPLAAAAFPFPPPLLGSTSSFLTSSTFSSSSSLTLPFPSFPLSSMQQVSSSASAHIYLPPLPHYPPPLPRPTPYILTLLYRHSQIRLLLRFSMGGNPPPALTNGSRCSFDYTSA